MQKLCRDSRIVRKLPANQDQADKVRGPGTVGSSGRVSEWHMPAGQPFWSFAHSYMSAPGILQRDRYVRGSVYVA